MINDVLHHLPHSGIRIVLIRLDLSLPELIVLNQAIQKPQHQTVHGGARLM